jgi:citrate synthase
VAQQAAEQAEVDGLKKQLAAERELPDQVIDFLKSTPKTALPIDVLRTYPSDDARG